MAHHQTTVNVSHNYCYCNLPVSSTTMWSHPLLSPGNNWTQMWSLLVSDDFWHGFETLCRFLLLQPWQSMLSSVDSCHGKTLMWGQALGQRERGVFSSCLRSLLTVSSSHLSMLTAIWSYYLSRCDRFIYDVLCTDWELCVDWRKVCAVSKLTPGRQTGQSTGNVKLLMGCRCCFGVEGKQWRFRE